MKLLSKILRRLLSFRYKVEIKGTELLDDDSTCLFMPSHVALVDPMIMYTFLREKVKVYPLATRQYYDNIFLKPFFKLF